MKRNSLVAGILIGALTSLPVVALSLLGAWLANLPPIPLDVFDWLARTLPGPLVGFGIDTMVALIRLLNLGPTDTTAKLGEQIMGLLTLVAGGAIFGGVLALLGLRKPQRLPEYGLLGGAALALVTVLIEASLGFKSGLINTVLWSVVLFLSWGAVLGGLLRGPSPEGQPAGPETTPEADASTLSRREFIYMGAASAAAVLVSAISLQNLGKSIPRTGGVSSATEIPASELRASVLRKISGPTNLPAESALAARFPPAPGTRLELTHNADFYRIDINTLPPVIDASSWRLELSGLVDQPLSLSLDDIRSRPSVSQALTMQCISNPVGGDLTGTTIWTGVPFKDILAEAGLQPGVKGIDIEAKDGFYEFVFLENAMDPRTLLVYAMNGEPLPVEHGYPLRIYIPNRYGMKQPKWITRMEAVDQERTGYWVERGWDRDAIVKTTAVVDTIAVESLDPKTQLVPVGGIAWAGDRGISKVEVQVDEGPWMPAQLRQPPLSPMCWVEWRYDWPAQAGRHNFSVRAYDGTGALQETEPQPPAPSGATGISTKRAVIRES